jgi:hypothetical protein
LVAQTVHSRKPSSAESEGSDSGPALGGVAGVAAGLFVMLYGLVALGSYSTNISDNAELCFLVIGAGVLLTALGVALLDPPDEAGPLPGDEL